MKPTSILGVLVLAGALGAAAGAAVVAFGHAPVPERDTALLDRLDRLTDGVEAMRASTQDSRDAVADLGERLVAVELELASRAAEPSRAAIAPNEPDEDAVASHGPFDVRLPEAGGWTRAVGGNLADMRLAASRAADQVQQLQANFAKAMELRALPEDERWQRIADDLGLNSVQVDEIRSAEGAFSEARKAAMTEETRTTDGGAEITMRSVDGEKMREARDEFDRRVETTLNDEQKKAWTDGGYRRAVGGGGPMVFRGGLRTRSGAEPSTGTVIIETHVSGD